jgi:signal transduction histidine kinase
MERGVSLTRISDIKALLQNELTGGLDIDSDIERARKVQLLNIVIWIGFVILLYLGLNTLQTTHTTQGLFDLSMAMVLLLLFFYRRRTGNTQTSALIGLLFVWLLFFYLFVTGGVESSGHVWLFTYPLFATFLLGGRAGTVLSIALLFCSLGFQMIFLDMEGVAKYGHIFDLRFTFCYLLITLFALFYEMVRSAIQRRMSEKNAELEEKISILRSTEEALIKSREELEQRVDQRTAALQKAVEYLQQQIAERERAERALLDSHERFAKVLEGIAADVYVADIQTYEILFVNRHMKDSLGNEALTGQTCFRAFRGLDGPCPDCSKHRILNPEGSPAGLFTWEALNPITGRWFVNYARAVAWDRGRMVRLQIATDITDRKLAEEALQKTNVTLEEKVRERTENIARINEALRTEIRQREAAQEESLRAKDAAESASRAKSEFLANMSHELRTPLNHIMGFTELVADKRVGDLNGEQQEYLHDVLGSSRHLLSLINDILDLSKVEAGKMQLERTVVDIRRLLDSSMVMVKEKAIKHGIRLEADYDSIPEMIQVDERKLKQVMYNLLSNAVKFTPDGGAVRVTAARVEERQLSGGKSPLLPGRDEAVLGGERTHLKIAVSDTGIGIRDKDLERIFAPFEQLDNSATRSYGGTGLGLSLTRRFVELHGGRIWAESEGPGKGSTIAFAIPVEVETDSPVNPSPGAVVNAGGT